MFLNLCVRIRPTQTITGNKCNKINNRTNTTWIQSIWLTIFWAKLPPAKSTAHFKQPQCNPQESLTGIYIEHLTLIKGNGLPLLKYVDSVFFVFYPSYFQIWWFLNFLSIKETFLSILDPWCASQTAPWNVKIGVKFCMTFKISCFWNSQIKWIRPY